MSDPLKSRPDDPPEGAVEETDLAPSRRREEEKRARAQEKRERTREKVARAAERKAEVERDRRERASPSPTAEELAERTAFFERAAPHTPHLGVQIDGMTFLVATKDHKVDRALFTKRGRPEFTVLARAVAILEGLIGPAAVRGRIFVDVGANIGTEAIAAIRSHGFDSAVCCEPDEQTYRLLGANIALNGLETRIRALEVGASSAPGRSTLVHIEGGAGNSWVAATPEQVRQAEEVRARSLARSAAGDAPEISFHEIEIETLDRLCESGVIDPDRVGLIWLDAEGHEGHVLSGAQALVERGVPLVMEFHPKRLGRSGELARIEDVAARCYTHFVDLRRVPVEPGQPRLRLRAVADLPELAATLLDPEISWSFTDMLLLRLEDARVPQSADLDVLFKRAPRSKPELD